MMTLKRPTSVAVAATAWTVLVGVGVLGAGVACTPPPPPSPPEGVLAIAYTNVTDDGDYDEGNFDEIEYKTEQEDDQHDDQGRSKNTAGHPFEVMVN